MKITADTNVLVRALVQDQPVQAEIASALLSRAEQVAIPLPVFCELVWVLRRVYGFTAADCTTAIEALIASRTVMADRPAVAAGLQLLASGGDFADGVIAFGGGSWAVNASPPSTARPLCSSPTQANRFSCSE